MFKEAETIASQSDSPAQSKRICRASKRKVAHRTMSRYKHRVEHASISDKQASSSIERQMTKGVCVNWITGMPH